MVVLFFTDTRKAKGLGHLHRIQQGFDMRERGMGVSILWDSAREHLAAQVSCRDVVRSGISMNWVRAIGGWRERCPDLFLADVVTDEQKKTLAAYMRTEKKYEKVPLEVATPLVQWLVAQRGDNSHAEWDITLEHLCGTGMTTRYYWMRYAALTSRLPWMLLCSWNRTDLFETHTTLLHVFSEMAARTFTWEDWCKLGTGFRGACEAFGRLCANDRAFPHVGECSYSHAVPDGDGLEAHFFSNERGTQTTFQLRAAMLDALEHDQPFNMATVVLKTLLAQGYRQVRVTKVLHAVSGRYVCCMDLVNPETADHFDMGEFLVAAGLAQVYPNFMCMGEEKARAMFEAQELAIRAGRKHAPGWQALGTSNDVHRCDTINDFKIDDSFTIEGDVEQMKGRYDRCLRSVETLIGEIIQIRLENADGKGKEWETCMTPWYNSGDSCMIWHSVTYTHQYHEDGWKFRMRSLDVEGQKWCAPWIAKNEKSRGV